MSDIPFTSSVFRRLRDRILTFSWLIWGLTQCTLSECIASFKTNHSCQLDTESQPRVHSCVFLSEMTCQSNSIGGTLKYFKLKMLIKLLWFLYVVLFSIFYCHYNSACYSVFSKHNRSVKSIPSADSRCWEHKCKSFHELIIIWSLMRSVVGGRPILVDTDY